MDRKNIVIATIKSWNIALAQEFKEQYKNDYNVFIITDKSELTYDLLGEIKPVYVFFPHWSWIISSDICENFECIVFHPTDLPYGRGGSPIQNLIVNKQYETKVSVIKADKGIDSGLIYFKEPFYLGTGNVEELLKMYARTIFYKLIPKFLAEKPIPIEQSGEVVKFVRRKPSESRISEERLINLNDFYDHIRMLDGEGYPKAFIQLGNFKILFSGVHKSSGELKGIFEIKEEKLG
ncbi:hypothetical protein KAW80_00340 [Candidatus Babeliales bacterium]|nr:hypothetical protein [Candidatus Babeliales bacterium]